MKSSGSPIEPSKCTRRRAVQVQRRTWGGQPEAALFFGRGRDPEPGVEHGPVVADGRGDVAGVTDGLFDTGHVVARLVSR